MRLKTKSILALGLLFLLGVLSLQLLRMAQFGEITSIVEATRTDQQELLDDIVGLNEKTLTKFTNDYSWWDDMVKMVHSPDAEWAYENIETSLSDFEAYGAWLYSTDFDLVYSINADKNPDLKFLPISTAEMQRIVGANRFPEFYVQSPAGLLHVCGAPVQPSGDLERKTPPQGWYFMARLWNEDIADTLAEITSSSIALHPATWSPPAQTDKSRDCVTLKLNDYNQKPVAILSMGYEVRAMSEIVHHNKMERLVMQGSLLSLIGVVIYLLHRSVLRPVFRLDEALANDTPDPLFPLKDEPSEFGALARRLLEAITQRKQLKDEVERRKNTILALQARENELHLALNENTRLGRDLHDGAIQTLYATGHMLANANRKIANDPNTASLLLEESRYTLNQVIQELRGFIARVEDQVNEGMALKDGIERMFQNLRHLHNSELSVQIEPLADGLISPVEKTQLLQIIREAISNALRHGKADQCRIEISRKESSWVLQIEDNGSGFNAKKPNAGHGLTNIQARSIDLKGICEIQSEIGSGTKISITFPIPPS